jgi:lipid-A-disaccharide synthase-like uncharacterized protein
MRSSTTSLYLGHRATGLLSLALTLCGPAAAQSAEPQAIRSLPSSVKPGDTVAVSISLRASREHIYSSAFLREQPPLGWQVISTDPPARVEATSGVTFGLGHSDLVLDTYVYHYFARVPPNARGTVQFHGSFFPHDSAIGEEIISVRGASTVQIGSSVSLWGFDINAWELLGIFATFVFASRFLVQWVASERKKRSVVPLAFWYLSIAGSLLLLLYGIHFRRLAVVMGQSFGFIVYIRNLMIIRNHARTNSAQGEPPKPL